MASRYGFLVMEDDPYRDLRYTGEDLPTIKSYDTDGHVAYLGSFSKIISPGLRVGYLAAEKDILRKCVIGKQGRIAKAIRTVMRSAANRSEQKISVEID